RKTEPKQIVFDLQTASAVMKLHPHHHSSICFTKAQNADCIIMIRVQIYLVKFFLCFIIIFFCLIGIS
ncbi:hypothetical protein, partial [Bartonella henselae]